jgi:hypothetical protein
MNFDESVVKQVTMVFKHATAILVAGGLLWMTGCAPAPHQADARAANADTPAGKAGSVAYKAAKETEKAAKEVGKKLDQATRDAHAGWKKEEGKGK